jgi:hypothetical protein
VATLTSFYFLIIFLARQTAPGEMTMLRQHKPKLYHNFPSFSELHAHLSGTGVPEFWSNVTKDFYQSGSYSPALSLFRALHYSNNVAALH